MSGEIRLPSQVTGKNVYFIIYSPSGTVWNASSFEAYATANRDNYDIAATEEGTQSGIYVADFPTAITSAGSYECIGYIRMGASPAEPPTDVLLGATSVDWSGTASVSGGTGSMSGSDFRDYVLRGGFKRTDKDTELYEAVTDTIQEMRRRFGFSEAQAETTTTDTISVAGDFSISIESDLGLLIGVVVEDGDDGFNLIGVSKAEFDRLYPEINVTSDTGFPKHYTVFADSIKIGPIPDSTSYSYRVSYSARAGTVTSSTTAVPFTGLYREILRMGTLARLWEVMDSFDRAQYFDQKFEEAFTQATRRELINSKKHFFTTRPQIL